ncbi:MAG: rod shape-determining protein MreD [Actinobacteria bacterium 13_1_20CM_2_65_11]|nr:MAG: rod shape-determining protein MreD [Chloroflexi bacterium 13_1_40CM_65_17]OLC67404.1 MAG: rod shape-determining protein MreD [Actinobacteria bacterium 13_1_40CM_4_65_12]OLD23414.1 MAG: rod shape-determining protein MreD [Chloroflexi bacterium 13_1_40CM_3_65_12]OLD46253.1 MAG: rod shape-determining protein MreD [Chloroflexi bacterium 13_1_40CM_2_68_14]OLE78723.1 MAG: rod shape-determining protein MreD [Actinobacteria bacterium 13_1_20CM_2_65_11]
MKAVAGLLFLLAAALVQVTWASRLEVAGAFPNVVLIAIIGFTWSQGVRAGLLWACVGGLLLDLNAPGPLGPHALALLVSAYVTGFWARNLDRESPLHPAGAAAAGTVLYSLVLIGADTVLGLPIPAFRTALQLVIAASVYNAAVMPLALLALRRVTVGLRWEPSAT